MKTILRVVGTLAALVVLLVTGTLAWNYTRAEARGTVPLERLERRGSALERSVARMMRDSLAVGLSTGGVEWHARREVSADGDTLRFRVYRSQDAGVIGRMLRPEPWVAGGAVYVVSERRFDQLGIGVR